MSPLILIAMGDSLVPRFFPSDLRQQLCELGTLAISPTPDDHSTPRARELFAEAEVVITGWGTARIDGAVLEAAPRLRGVVHSAGTVREIVSPECYDAGLVVSSQAWANALPVAEYALAMILLSAKGAFAAEHVYRSRRDSLDVLDQLADRGAYRRRVGIVGASTVGRRVMELLAPFDLEVVVSDPTVDTRETVGFGATLVPLGQLLSSSDIVSLHAPLLPSTAGMIGADELALLRDGATFVNTARGALVDQEALVRRLESGRIAAVLDVTDGVPASDSPLWELPNVVLTPHIAGAAGTELHRLGSSAVEEVGRVLNGQSLLHPVTRDRYDAIA